MAGIKTPDFKLTIGVLDFSEEPLRSRVNEIEVDQESDSAGSFKIVLDDRDDLFSNGKESILEGASVKIELGYVGQLHQVIIGKVTGVKPQRKESQRKLFIVNGFDDLQKLSRGRKRRSWENIKDSDLASEIANEVGLQPDVEDSGIVNPYVVQNNLSNLSFLYERARRIGYEVKVEENRLVFKKPREKEMSIVLRWDAVNVEKRGGTLMQRMNFDTTTMNVVKKVVVRSYDPKTASPIIGIADKISGGSMDGTRDAGEAADSYSVDTTIQISDQPVASQEEAERLAQSILDQRAGGYLTGSGRCEGNSEMVCGAKVKILDVGKDLEGAYYITSVKHSLKVGHGHGFGYWTEYSVSRTGR